MRVQSPQAGPVAGAGDGGEGLAGWVASGPGLWLGELAGLDREGLLEQLLGDGTVSGAVAAAPHGHKLDRVLTAKNTLLSVIAGCLFAGQDYDQVIVPGDRERLLASGWEVADATALADVRRALADAGVPVKPGTPDDLAARRVGELPRFDDPAGNAIEVSAAPRSSIGRPSAPAGTSS